MTKLCETCSYRTTLTTGFSICEYCNINKEPRGCDPKDCKKLGKYKEEKRILSKEITATPKTWGMYRGLNK